MWEDPTRIPAAPATASSRVGDEAVEVGQHRVGEVGAVDLEREAEPGAGEDHRAHHQVVGERRVDAAERLDHLADRGHVGVEVAIELGVGELGEGLHLEALVAVVHVDR